MVKKHLELYVLIFLGLFGGANAAEVKPFVFENIAQDSASQQNEFNYMLKYKLFGRDYLTIGNDVVIQDKSGWNGTAGDMNVNARLSLGGPVLVVGDITMGDQQTLTTGPVRANSMTMGNDNGSYITGKVCLVNTSVSSSLSNIISRSEGHLYAADATECDSVPESPANLSIPTITWPDTMTRSIVFSSSENGDVQYIDVPDGEGTFDIFLNSIEYKLDHQKLIVRMQDGGRLTRIFVKNFSYHDHGQIQVAYRTDSTDYLLSQKEYRGNVMFYTDQSISIEHSDNSIMQGTLISTQEIYLACNINFAGQLLANQLRIGDTYNGENFKFVPFDPPVLDMPELDREGGLLEDNQTVSIPIKLDTAAIVDVLFSYCFDLRDGVELSDFNYEVTAFPLCSAGESVNVTIAEGETMPDNPILINVKYDELDEPNDWLVIKIEIESGAVLPGNKTSGELKIRIIDATKPIPETSDTTIADLEDASIQFKVEDFPYSPLNTNPKGGVIITSTPSKGVLTYKGNLVVVDQLIPVDSIGDLLYAGVKDSFGTQYDSFKFKVVDTWNTESAESTMTIDLAPVNDPPTATATTFEIAENSDVGTSATGGELKVEDVDDQAFVYTLVGGDSSVFKINPSTGEISVKSAVLDHEAKAEYTVTVHVRDMSATTGNLADTLSYELPVTIIVTDVNEKPTVNDTTLTVPENSDTGTVVGPVIASDPDTAKAFSTLTYTIVESDVPFRLDSNIVKVNDPTKLNYESDSVFTFHVVVSDGQYKETATVVVKLSDMNEGPQFTDKTPNFDVDENEPEGTLVGTVKATDVDGTDTLVYTIIDSTGTFVVDSLTGKITVKADSTLDYETKATYVVKVVVTDKENLTDTATVTITVNDKNESPSIEEAEFAVDENSSKGDSVGVVVASDLDTAEAFRILTYEIIESDVPFTMDSATIRVKDSTTLDFETTPEFSFHVVVIDQDGLSDTALITVKLNDVNEPPVFTDDKPTLTVDENVPAGTEVGPVTATDVDDGDTLTYTIDDPTGTFVIDSTTGLITVKADSTIDYEYKNEYTVTVIVTDKDGLKDTATVTIKVNDLNEAPVIEDKTFSVSEDAKKGDVVDKVEARDPDKLNPEFGTLTYSLVGESDVFDVKSDGTIVLKDTLDHESDSVYTIKVRVTDGQLSDTALITINVIDVEEWTEVEITRAESKDSVWISPDTVYINRKDICVEWKADGKLMEPDCRDDLHEGENLIIEKWLNPTKDHYGYDTLVVYVSTESPIVTVKKVEDETKKPNIFTIVEKQAKSDSSFYVNDKQNDIQVTVKDPVSGARDSFVVKLNLDTLKIPSKTYTTTLDALVDAKVTLNDKPASGITSTPVNGDRIANTYTEVVNGKEVSVTYYTGKDGKIIKNDDGVRVMTVTYETVVDGKTVKISYQVNSKTGEMVKSTGGYADPTDAIESSSSSKGGKSSSSKGGKSSSSSKSVKPLEDEVVFTVTYDYVDPEGNTITVSYGVDANGKLVRNEAGNLGYEVGYTYTNKYGNSATQSVFIVLDQTPPKVEILFPNENEVIYSNFVDVKWTVDLGDGRGAVVQDTLITQGLEKGGNIIVRYYRDKAGNEASDTVRVIMKNAKDVDISVEQPVTVVTREKTEEYYSTSKPKEGETFAVTIYNTKTDKEVETLIGGSFDNKKGSGDEPYPGLEGHLGPTLGIDTKLPTVNAVGGLATLDDLLNEDGDVPLEGVDAENSAKMTVSEYVDKYCDAEFAESLGSDISRANLYTTKMYVKIWIYTSLGQFVDFYSFTQDLDNPDYTNDAGLLTLYFEMKPDKDGNVRSETGRLYATGAYVYKTEVEMKSTLRCSVPPMQETSKGKYTPKKESNTKGTIRSVKEDMLKSFGYKRPKMK